MRFSDFKSNEYANLLGGKFYEPEEENPMIGWRGCSRYYSPQYKQAFGLECEAIKRVRDTYGLTNVVVMLPFCRTVKECLRVQETMAEYGLVRGENGLKVGKKIGICGQAPSDHPNFAKFLFDEGIDTISLTPDSIIPTIQRLGQN